MRDDVVGVVGARAVIEELANRRAFERLAGSAR
jgi:hypothetical protein